MPSSGKSLKDQNRRPLVVAALMNIFVFFVLRRSTPIPIDTSAALREAAAFMPICFVFLIVGLLADLLDSNNKARLVFWHWNSPLPGARAFSKLAENDSRIDRVALEQKIGPLPVAARDQNTTWYKLYLKLSEDDRVLHVHRIYLFARDYTAISLVFLLLGAPLSLLLLPGNSVFLIYLAFLLLQYFLVRQVAKHNGERLVTTVLALTAAQS